MYAFLSLGLLILALSVCQGAAAQTSADAGATRNVTAKPLSAMAELGKKLFFDPALSASGKLSCASCHDPAHHYAPANNLAVQIGGSGMQMQGARAVPSLTYHEHQPVFSIGPDTTPDDDNLAAGRAVQFASNIEKAPIGIAAKAGKFGVQVNVPQGGFDWDGRAASLTDQAGGPLLAINEMANPDPQSLLDKLKAASYANDFTVLFGPAVFSSTSVALGETYFALAQYQNEDRSFHPYDSKFDNYLAGRVALSEQELRGLKLFRDPKKGNCASCHPVAPSADGRHAPVFTDYQFEALAAPRNRNIVANRDPNYFDLGLCGPLRQDGATLKHYCGFFKTPSLRNSADRQVFFHNGVFTSLNQVVHFYVERETRPEKWYPVIHGKLVKYDDIPPDLSQVVDVSDAPFDRGVGDDPALSEQEIADVVVFLGTLTDGFQPSISGF